MQTNHRKRWAEVLSFLLMIEIFYFYNNYMTIGGFGVGYQYIGCILLILVGGMVFLIEPVPIYLYHSVKTAGVLATSYLVAMLFSAAIWIFDFTPIRQMISGFFEPMYMLLCISAAVSFIYICRDKAAPYAFWALTVSSGLLTAQRIAEFGVAEFFRRLVMYIGSGGTDGNGVSLEETSYAYLYVFFALYFLFQAKKEAWWKTPLRMGVIVFGLLETFKRSGLLALALGILAAFLYLKCPKRYRNWLVGGIILTFLFFAILYIPVVRYGLFSRIMEALHINTSSRDRIYAYYAAYYEFSPSYLGRGLGWVWRLMSEADRFNVGLVSVNVHCDYVRHYIELGFWGYILWTFFTFPWLLKKIKGVEQVDGAVILGITVAMAVLRLTENISYLYSAALGMSILIIQSAQRDQFQLFERER